MTTAPASSSVVPARGPIFISYSSHDAAVATTMCNGLEAAGLRCWMAPRDIDPGASFPAAITAAISSSEAMVLLLTGASNASPHVLSEVELAFNARKPILAVIVGKVTPSPNLQYFISTTHWFDAESSFDANDLERLRVDLEKLLAGQRIRLDEERAARRRSRARTVAAAATIAVIVLAAYLLWPRSSSPPATANSGAGSPGAGAPSEASRASTPGGSPVTPSPPTAATSSGVRSRVNARDGQIYVWVPPGRFAMGCSTGDPQCQPDEMPAHAVRIDKGFWLAKTEVTVGQYVARHPGWHLDIPARDDEPARDITRSDAKAYCASIGGRLPTEAEWEYAARGGTSERYYDSLSSIAWYEDNSDGHPHAVAGKEPNAYGLYDMLGNVYEWAFDRYYNKYDDTSGEIEEPLAPNASGVARGGAWTSEANDVRVSNRFDLPRDYTDPRVGFRCALDDK